MSISFFCPIKNILHRSFVPFREDLDLMILMKIAKLKNSNIHLSFISFVLLIRMTLIGVFLPFKKVRSNIFNGLTSIFLFYQKDFVTIAQTFYLIIKSKKSAIDSNEVNLLNNLLIAIGVLFTLSLLFIILTRLYYFFKKNKDNM